MQILMKMNTPIQTLLVPTDFTDKSRNAVNLAVQVALRHEALMLITHTVPANFIIDHTGRQLIGGERVSQNVETAVRELRILYEALTAQYPALKLETRVTTGDVCDSLNELALELGADLIIMGTSGVQKFRQALLGSHSYSVLNRAVCSVMLMPESRTQYEFKKILFPVRAVDHLALKMEFALAIANRNESEISLMGVGNMDNMPAVRDAFLQMKEQLHHNAEHFNSKLVLTADNAEMISQTTEAESSDLVILNFEDEMKWKSLFSENFFKKIINDTDTALLFVKPQNPEPTPVDINSYDITLPIPG